MTNRVSRCGSQELNLASIRDIAAMKIDAITSRGARRDFVDMYFICRSGYALSNLPDFYNQKYGLLAPNLVHIKKSLIYFEDAEREVIPRMLKDVGWDTLKQFFVDEVRKLA